MAAQHTPGPWEVRHSTISWWIEAPSDKSRFVNGPLPADTWHMERTERQGCRALCDAHLIAAAPDLLEALQAIADLPGEVNTANYNDDDVRALNNAHIEAYQIAMSAIAKARGES